MAAKMIVFLFNDIADPEVMTPQSWTQSSITLLFQDGDPRVPSNYKPITIIPLLYKLFSRLLRRRLTPILDASQCIDQAGFRFHFSALRTT